MARKRDASAPPTQPGMPTQPGGEPMPLQPGLNTVPGEDGFMGAVNREAQDLKGQAPARDKNDDPLVFIEMESDQMGSYERKLPMSQVVAQYFSWSHEMKQAFVGSLEKIGMDTSKMTDSALFDKWADYVNQSAAYTSVGKPLSPWGVVTMDIFNQEHIRRRQIEEPPKPDVTTVATSSDVKFSTALDAKGILYTASKSLLGRAPTEAEASSFWAELNAAEGENPQLTTTTTTRAGTGEIKTQDQVTSGGMSADAKQMLTLESAKRNPEFGAYQAATTYQDALMGMVYGKGY